MRTKKLLFFLLLAAFGTMAQAQIVSSRSDQLVVTEVVKPRTLKWNVRAGYSFDTMTGADGIKSASGFDASFGISKPFSSNGLFWGIEVGAMSYNAALEGEANNEGDDHGPAFTVGFTLAPRIGFKIPIADEMALALYVGPYGAYRLEESTTLRNYTSSSYTKAKSTYPYTTQTYHTSTSSEKKLKVEDGIDVGLNAGLEFFVSKNFFFNLQVKKSFTETGYLRYESSYSDSGNTSNNRYTSDKKDIYSFKFMVGIGFQF